ncbi:putative Ig domain-containing protein [Dyadobacter sandarakinus]|uniref:Beta-galactosidase n=1 Tax=Dyadobacter sandarakinus TaxID=2747268 RepID=A0ABX7IAL4_9BACT|nr:putative Ig domain-containing protein [Dyadobacter sandarakinus]QRR02984.1 beta-galactosidase [Dyadobacter sandarakinus]
MHYFTSVAYCLSRFALLLVFWLFGTVATAQGTSGTTEADHQRYLALMLLNLTDAANRGPEPDLIRSAASYGLNSVYITIPWDKIYATPDGAPQWAKYDEQIKIATDLGMKVALRIHIGRNITRINGFWTTEDSQFSHSRLPLLSGYQDTFFGFDNQSILNKAVAFVKAVTTRYKYLRTDNKLLFVSVTNTSTQEGEYPSGLIVNGVETSAVYDYSRTMEKGFQAFLKEHYKKIERLNFLWGTTYKSFEEAPAPSTGWEPINSFKQRAGKDWYLYRHIIFRNYTDQLISAVKEVDPAIRFVSDYGSVFDAPSVMRGTLAFRDLNKNTDGIKINDNLATHDHRWSVDILKSDAPADFITANELFVSSYFDGSAHLKQINENFEHGANIVAVVITTPPEMARSESFLRPAAANWLPRPIPVIQYADSVGYRLSAAVEKGGPINVIYNEWAKRAYADPANPRPIKIHLDEDLLAPAYWDDASNYPPYVFRPVPMQIIAVNKDFTYRLPTDTFSDVDGTIVRIETGTLPAWLTYQSGQLRGRPTALGDFRIAVRGIDDEGGSAEAFFTIRVEARDNLNKPPTVNANFTNQLAGLNEAFSLQIPANAFADSDGRITRIEASELPPWLTFSGNTLSGTPRTLGQSRIILKAYDNQDAFVETYFTIRVVEPQYLNAPPYASSTLPVKYAQVNMPFSYILPTNIFGDPDGYISAITIQNRPSWLDFSLNVFSGTPTEEGEYRLIVRAYDNGGAYVEIPFILKVEIPEIRFELVQGGSRVDQQVLRKLSGNDALQSADLPPLLNIFAYGNFEYDQVTFDLTGPYKRHSTTSTFPYALFENGSGFAPYVGRYTLTVTAAKEDSAIVTNSIQFSIAYSDSLNIAGDMEDWRFYPNPVENVFNVKLPQDLQPADIQYTIVNSLGKVAHIPPSLVKVSDYLANIDLSKAGISSGIYFLRIESGGMLLKQFRVFKR